MTISFSKIQPYLEIDIKSHDTFDFIINKKGDVTIPFKMMLPEIYTLGENTVDLLIDNANKAFGLFTEEVVIHRQDFFFKDKFKGLNDPDRSGFLYESHERHFFERGFLNHKAYLYLTIPNQRQAARNIFNSTFFNKGRSITDFNVRKPNILDFIAQAERCMQIINDTKLIKITPVPADEVEKLMLKYFSLNINSVSDFFIDSQMKDLIIGDNRIRIYSLNNAETQFDIIKPSLKNVEYSTDSTQLTNSFLFPICHELDFDHIVNTMIYKENSETFIKAFEQKQKTLNLVRFMSRENIVISEANEKYINEYREDMLVPCRFHTNVVTWNNDIDELKKQDNKIVSAYQKIGCSPYLNKLTPAVTFWGSAPGNAGDLPSEETYPTFLRMANCCQNYETNYRTSVGGIVLYDRQSQIPVVVDLWDEPYRNKIIANRNCIAIGPSGEGKSVFFNHIFSQYYEQGYNLVIMDIGNSYKKLCEIYGGKYLVYDETDPLPFNPFLISENMPNNEDLDFLKELLFICWKRQNPSPETNAILTKALEAYYKELRIDDKITPGFPSFYQFVKNIYSKIIKKDFNPDFFDIDSFLLVLEEFAIGKYKKLFDAKETLNVKSDRLIVFELDNIKDHPVLFPIVALIITHTIDKTVFKVKGAKKAIWLDEAWKIIEKDGMDQFVKYLYKTIRKHNGQAGIIVQDITDIPDTSVGNAIINNCAIKFILPHKNNLDAVPTIAKKLSFTENDTNILASASSNLKAKHPYTEIFVKLGAISKAYRLELSPESYWAFTSDEIDNERLLKEKNKHGNIELAIKQVIENNLSL